MGEERKDGEKGQRNRDTEPRRTGRNTEKERENRRTDGRTDRQTGRQTDRQTGRQTDRIESREREHSGAYPSELGLCEVPVRSTSARIAPCCCRCGRRCRCCCYCRRRVLEAEHVVRAKHEAVVVPQGCGLLHHLACARGGGEGDEAREVGETGRYCRMCAAPLTNTRAFSKGSTVTVGTCTDNAQRPAAEVVPDTAARVSTAQQAGQAAPSRRPSVRSGSAAAG
jgi:hypothetical protein